MFEILRSEFYRMIHGRLLWICLLLFEALLLISAIMMAVVVDNAETIATLTATSSDVAHMIDALNHASSLQLYGQGFVSGSWIAMLTCIFVAIFFMSEFRTGAIKNMMQAQGGRMTFAAAGMVVCAAAALIFVVAGVVGCELFFRLAGFSFQMSGIAEVALWFLQVWLVVFAYTSIVYLAACTTQSTVFSVIIGFLLGGYALENVLTGMANAVAALTGHLPAFDALANFFMNDSLMVYLSALSSGNASDPSVFGVAAGVVIVMAVINVLVMRRRSLA